MRSVALFVWTAGYTGLVPVAPGTAGSLVGLGLVILVRAAEQPELEPLVFAVILVVGVWAAGVAERHYGLEDPATVVVDEVAGMLLTLLWIPVGSGGLVLAFLAFRVFDIVKPFPARAAERLPGGWGVMADDMVAGVYAHAAVRLLAAVVPSVVL